MFKLVSGEELCVDKAQLKDSKLKDIVIIIIVWVMSVFSKNEGSNFRVFISLRDDGGANCVSGRF